MTPRESRRHFYYITSGAIMRTQVQDYSRKWAERYPAFRVDRFAERNFQPEQAAAVIDEATRGSGIFSITEAGRSFEGRPIRLISAGGGPVTVLLWSQMHGDESTATMSICDILNCFAGDAASPVIAQMLKSLTFHFLPVLNPDGAARFQRRTAQGIDMNRDALALQTPEANILKGLQNRLKPAFGFNLHDQELSTIASTPQITALALLAPAFDQTKSVNQVRLKAKQLASVFAESMEPLIPGKVARYDDSYEPRAFGDSMQTWGTSTLLVEGGHIPGDHEKSEVRRLMAIGMLTAFQSLADGTLGQADVSKYEVLPMNGKRAYDVVVRNIRIDHGNGTMTSADLGISAQVDTHSEPPAKIVDIGDLSVFTGMKVIEGGGKILPEKQCHLGGVFEAEKMFGN
jgi:hypothetical protein